LVPPKVIFLKNHNVNVTCRKNHLTALKEPHWQKDHFFEGLQVNTPFVDLISNKNRFSPIRPCRASPSTEKRDIRISRSGNFANWDVFWAGWPKPVALPVYYISCPHVALLPVAFFCNRFIKLSTLVL
jgi:hypothetical protein